MRTLLQHAVEAAGLEDIAGRALSGDRLGDEEVLALRQVDTLLLSVLADEVRRRRMGDEVTLLDGAGDASERAFVMVDCEVRADGSTGEQALRQVALVRLATPGRTSVGVDWDEWGLELAQVALLFGADLLAGNTRSRKSLPLLETAHKRREEIDGLVRRAGRQPRWQQASHIDVGRRS